MKSIRVKELESYNKSIRVIGLESYIKKHTCYRARILIIKICVLEGYNLIIKSKRVIEPKSYKKKYTCLRARFL